MDQPQMRKPLTAYLEASPPKRSLNFQTQIEQAASGCISGYLDEWPVLAKALAHEGLTLPNDTQSSALRKICQMILELDKSSQLEAEVVDLLSGLVEDRLEELDSNGQNV